MSDTASEGSNVRVGVRVRPLLPRELAESARVCLTHPHKDSVMIGKVRATVEQGGVSLDFRRFGHGYPSRVFGALW
jgi:hypothetical protein